MRISARPKRFLSKRSCVASKPPSPQAIRNSLQPSCSANGEISSIPGNFALGNPTATPALGRKTRLSESQRQQAWAIFEKLWTSLDADGLVTLSAIYTRLAERLQSTGTRPYTAAVVDESQDLAAAQLRFLATLTSDQKNGLFFAGDLGQRIFQAPFSWKSFGVDIRGRSTTLKVNYRTSHQIRSQADRLLGPEVSDINGNVEDAKRIGIGPAIRQ